MYHGSALSNLRKQRNQGDAIVKKRECTLSVPCSRPGVESCEVKLHLSPRYQSDSDFVIRSTWIERWTVSGVGIVQHRSKYHRQYLEEEEVFEGRLQ